MLERPAALAALLETLAGYDRLVLLGDIVEMQEVPATHSAPVAEPILRAIAEQLGADKQLLLLPGNHDHALVQAWAKDRGPALQREDSVPADASPWLTQVVSSLSATRVEVRYPGVWLSDRIWATHGHYLNEFMRPVSSWGLHVRPPAGPNTPAEFESLIKSPPKPHLIDGLPQDRWLDKHVPARLAPLNARLLGHQMMRHAMPAFARSARALGVEADWIIFGHVHRRGPREGDKLKRWTPVPGATSRRSRAVVEPAVATGPGARSRSVTTGCRAVSGCWTRSPKRTS